jgi:hypothetical protein
MGTSGAYGGSGTASWGDAHDLYEDAAGGGAARPPVEDLVKAFTAALNKTKGGPPPAPGAYTPAATRPGRPAGTGGYTHSKTSTVGGGRSGLAASAARGAAAVAGARAYRARDAQTLTDLGLDLAALDALPDDTARCEAISQRLLGVPAHPEDAALNSVAMQTMLAAMEEEDEPGAERLVEIYAANLAYEFVLVELTSEHRKDPVPSAEAAEIEEQVKEYIANDISNPVDKPVSQLSAQGLMDMAASLAGHVLGIFRRTR